MNGTEKNGEIPHEVTQGMSYVTDPNNVTRYEVIKSPVMVSQNQGEGNADVAGIADILNGTVQRLTERKLVQVAGTFSVSLTDDEQQDVEINSGVWVDNSRLY